MPQLDVACFLCVLWECWGATSVAVAAVVISGSVTSAVIRCAVTVGLVSSVIHIGAAFIVQVSTGNVTGCSHVRITCSGDRARGGSGGPPQGLSCCSRAGARCE